MFKKGIIFFISIILASGCSSAQTVKDRLEMPEIGKKDIILNYSGFTVSYNSKTLTPKWVAYELTSEEVDGEFSRSGNFGMDMNYHGRQAMREDYSNSGWDKGHMAPAADMKWSEKAMHESFNLTNVCPQNHELNGKSWQTLEKKVRALAKKYGRAYVVCGPITGEGKYGTIGDRRVHVPDAFFKAILVPHAGSYSGIAFVMTNDAHPQPMSSSMMTINELEIICGYDLFVNLDNRVEEQIENEIKRSVWGL